MRRTFSLIVCLIALSSAAALAQPAPAAQRGTAVTPVASAQGPTPAPAAKSVDVGADNSDANITIEITVVDKAAGATTMTTRLGTITVANGNSGAVRGLSGYYSGNNQTNLDPAGLDIDARTYLRKSGMVSVYLTVGYIPTGAEKVLGSAQRQQAALFLKPGQETQVLTTGSMTGAGPAVRITAKATVIR